ncbi:hypothetical protein N9D27_00530 [Gammaproteobacteria bacterium]|nr:hypothetical protein [Gammaproteobacteria bacterium]
MSTKKINTNTISVYTNTYNLENAIAASIFMPSTANKNFKDIEGIDNSNYLVGVESLMPINSLQFSELKNENIDPVIITIDSREIQNFFNASEMQTIKSKQYTFILLPFLPIHFIESIIFSDAKSLKNFQTTKFSNLNKDESQFKMIHQANLFPNKDHHIIFEESEYTLKDSPVPISKITLFDSILGGIQASIYLSKKPELGNAERFFKIIQGILDDTQSTSTIEWFDFDISETLQTGLRSIKADDPLHVKFYKAALIKFSSEAYTENAISLPFLESIFLAIPRILLTEDDEVKIDKFLLKCSKLVSGTEELEDNFFVHDNWIIAKALILLLTQSGKNQMSDIIDNSKALHVSDKILFTSIMLFGFYRNYSSLSLAFKEKPEFQKSISLLSKRIILGRGKVLTKKDEAPHGTGHWWDLCIDKDIFARVSIANIFLASISGQALEAGYNFKTIGDKKLALRKIDDAGTDLILTETSDDFFSIETDSLLPVNDKKLTKPKLIKLLELMADIDIRSGLICKDKSLILRQVQLSSTLDIDEIKSMIDGLYKDWDKVKSSLD